MKTRKFPIIAISILTMDLLVRPAFAIVYFRSDAAGHAVRIQGNDLKECKRLVYRTSGKSELSLENKKLLLEALLRGETVNNLQALMDVLKHNPGYCSYADDSEKLP